MVRGHPDSGTIDRRVILNSGSLCLEPHDVFQSRASQIGKAFANWCEITIQSISFILWGKAVLRKPSGAEMDMSGKDMNGETLRLIGHLWAWE